MIRAVFCDGTIPTPLAIRMEPVEIHGLPTQVVELTGEPGKVILAHPALLHATSINALAVPRIMRRTHFRRKRPKAN